MDKKNLTEKEKREKKFTEETLVLVGFFIIIDIVCYLIKPYVGLLMVTIFMECFAMCFFALTSNNSPMNSKNQ